MNRELTAEQCTQVGEKLVKLLNIKLDENGRVDMGEYGTKTPLGMVRVITRLIEEA